MKLISYEQLKDLRDMFPEKRIVHCHGVFDLFHYGHLQHLRSAKKFGDLLVVTITPDCYVNKGPNRPAFAQNKRAEIIAELDIVDFVAVNISKTAVTAINALRPNFYVKGPDYKIAEEDISGGIYKEKIAIESVGGVLAVTHDPSESSTSLINMHFNQMDGDQKDTIEKLKKTTTLEEILRIIDGFKEIKVLVVGEPIIDHYVFCKPENLSSKSPTVSANFIDEEFYAGGVWAVAAHLASLGCKTSLIAPRGNDEISESLEKMTLESGGISLIKSVHKKLKTPKKTRFISPFMNQRIFELTNLDAEAWYANELNDFNLQLREISNQYDIVLALDFGHGLWEGERLKTLEGINTFKALNVQTNSGNYGFNLFHKHQKYDYLALDERELRLGMHDRFSNTLDIAKQAFDKRISGGAIGVTLGAKGSSYLSREGELEVAPTFFDQPIDTTGAGDAFFAITSILTFNKCDALTTIFLGNLFAGLKTKIIGNKSPVSVVDLVRSVKSLLL